MDSMFCRFQKFSVNDGELLHRDNTTRQLSYADPLSSSVPMSDPQFVPELPRGIFAAPPAPGFPPRPSEDQISGFRDLDALFRLMTSPWRSAEFTELVHSLDEQKLMKFVARVVKNKEFFLEVAQKKTGSTNLRKLLGKTVIVNNILFFTVISTKVFLPLMKEKYGYYVAIETVRCVDRRSRSLFYRMVESHALDLAYDDNGCVALNVVMSTVFGPEKHKIFDIICENALWLSKDTSGNFAVKHLLQSYNPYCAKKIAMNLRGHYVDLSLEKYGSFIVEKLLEVSSTTPLVQTKVLTEVLTELLGCDIGHLMKLGRNQYGNYVLQKALTIAGLYHYSLYEHVVLQLRPKFGILGKGYGRNIVALVESFSSKI